jgi:hypothetical protein
MGKDKQLVHYDLEFFGMQKLTAYDRRLFEGCHAYYTKFHLSHKGEVKESGGNDKRKERDMTVASPQATIPSIKLFKTPP